MRRWWLTSLVGVWIVVLGGLVVWSVDHDRATVPEQRDIDLALADLERAAGVVYAAADGDDRAVVLGELQLTRDCRITPVRSGLAAARAVTVYVADTKTAEAVEQIAAGLPADWATDWGRSSAGTRVSLHADAGNFVGIDLSSPAVATTFTLRLTTGCRPLAGEVPRGAGEASPSPAPALLSTVVGALGGNVGEPVVHAVTCPSGGVAGSWTVAGVSTPDDLPGHLRPAGEVVHADETVRAYRNRDDSVVVRPEGAQLSVTVSTPC